MSGSTVVSELLTVTNFVSTLTLLTCVRACVQVQGEIQEIVKTGLWVGDCFIYTSSVNRLNYFVGGEIVTIAHLDRCVSLDILISSIS